MTLYSTIKELQRIALTQPNVNFVGEGDLYADMNSNPSLKYSAFYITQNRHYSDEAASIDRYSFNLFYIDRQIDTEGSNALEIQSIGKEVIENIIRIFCETYDADIYGTMEIQPWVQRFSDLCAGVYAVVTLEISKDSICVD